MTLAWIHSPPRAALLVAVTGLTLQLIYLIESRNDPTFDVPIVDAEVYHEAALRFATGETAASGPFWQPPLFPFLLGRVYALVGPSVVAAKVVLALTGTGSCVFVWAIGRRLFSPPVGFIAGCMLAGYGPIIFFNMQLLPAGPAAFLDLLAIYLLLRADEHPSWLRWLAFGVCTGLAVITVPNAFVILILGLALLIARAVQGRHWRDHVLHGVVAAAGTAATIAPVTVHNYRATHEFIPISVNGGINFFIGNNPDADRTVAVRPGAKWERLTRVALANGPRTQARQDRHFFKRGLAYFYQDPIGFFGGLVRKGGRLLNAREIPRNVDLYVHRSYSHLLSVLAWRAGPIAFPFGLFLPLAAVGAVTTFRTGRATGASRTPRTLLLAFLALYAFSVAMFFVAARYRLPATPALCVFAAAGTSWTWQRVAGRTAAVGSRDLWMACLAFVLAAIVANRPITAPTDHVNFRAELYMNVGRGHMKAGRLIEAERHLRHAIELDRGYAQAYCKLAQVFFWSGRAAESQTLLRRAVELDPEDTEAYWLLGALRLQHGRKAEAVVVLEQALKVDPRSPQVHIGLADALLALDRVDEAIAHYQQADRIEALSGDTLVRLADALVRRDRYSEAIECYTRALQEIDPAPEMLNRVARLLATCPQVELRDCDRAIALAERVCRLTAYQHPAALETLAAAYAECGRFEEALRAVERAIESASSAGDAALLGSLRDRRRSYRQRLKDAGPQLDATDDSNPGP